MILYFINLIISSVSFVGLYFYKTGRVYPIDFYVNLLPIFVLSFIFLSAYFKSDHLFFKDRTKTELLIFIFTLFIMSLFISLNRISSVSRLFILIITASSVLIQWALGFFWQKKQTSSFNNKSVGNIDFKLKRLFFSLLILIVFFAVSCTSSGVKKRKGCKGTGSWEGRRNLSSIIHSTEKKIQKNKSDKSCFMICNSKNIESF